MLRQTGRDCHTYVPRGKPVPVPVGLKVHALCEAGYTYTWVLDSPLLPAPAAPERAVVELADAGKRAAALALELPWQQYGYCLFLDNPYSSVRLFSTLRRYNVACCGTTRVRQEDYPPAHKQVQLNKEQWDIDTVSSVVASVTGVAGSAPEPVLSVVFMSRVLLRMLTTAHAPPETQIIPRKRPVGSDAFTRFLTRRYWDNNLPYDLKIPQLLVYHSFYMYSEEIGYQERPYLSTQSKACRTWLPLFFWLLDTAVLNALVVARDRLENEYSILANQRRFRIRLAWSLVHTGAQLLQEIGPTSYSAIGSRGPQSRPLQSSRSAYVTQGWQRPPLQGPLAIHQPTSIPNGKRRHCKECLYLRAHGQGEGRAARYTHRECVPCGAIALCKDHFTIWHSREA